MSPRVPAASCLLFAVLSLVSSARADAFDEQVLREAAAYGPEVEQAMRAGRAASDAGDATKASEAYGRALVRAPEFDHALRRKCGAERALGHRGVAVGLCRRALALRESPYNLSALVAVLGQSEQAADKGEADTLLERARTLYPGHEAVLSAALDLAFSREDESAARTALSALRQSAASPQELAEQLARVAMLLSKSPAGAEERDEANRLAIEAFEKSPGRVGTLAAVAQVALQVEDAELLERATRRLTELAPDALPTHFYTGMQRAMTGDFEGARTAFTRARDAGFPEDDYTKLMGQLDEAEPWTAGLGTLALRIAGVWFASLVALFLSGMLLSALTLRAARNLPREPNGRSSGANRVLRHAYALVLGLACVFYYLSLPLVALTVVGAAAAVFYGFFVLGQIPIKIAALVAIFVLVTVWAVLRSVFVRARDEPPGTPLDVARHPRLRALLDEVARRVGTRAVDTVYLTPGVDVAVLERGGLMKKLSGTSERCLVLGLGVLDGMRLSDFKAVLAHEYGHFSNRDTAGGGMALAVRSSLLVMARSLAEGGAATWYNPAWWFFRGFFAVFLRISQGASRLQEVLADRWAAFCYGSEAFVRGLHHVVERSVRFDVQTHAALPGVTESRTPLTNFYSVLREAQVSDEDVARKVQEAIDRAPSPYDSHPAPRDRFAWVRSLAVPDAADDASDEVWSLFHERESLEEEMTHEVNHALGLRAKLEPAATIDWPAS